MKSFVLFLQIREHSALQRKEAKRPKENMLVRARTRTLTRAHTHAHTHTHTHTHHIPHTTDTHHTISQSLRPTMEAACCFSVTLSYIDVLNNNNYEVFCAVSPD